MVAGGGPNLKSTKILTFLEGEAPAEAYSISPERLQRAREQPLLMRGGELGAEAKRSIRLLIQMFPDNCLHTIRYQRSTQ